jgi:hypothetical protein
LAQDYWGHEYMHAYTQAEQGLEFDEQTCHEMDRRRHAETTDCESDHIIVQDLSFFSLATPTDVVIGFEETMYSASEADGVRVVAVTVLQGELSGPVVVRMATTDGTAISGSDYNGVNLTLTFGQVTTTIAVTVPILEDNIDEEDETLLARLVLEEAVEGLRILIQPEEAVLTIEDNDS